MNPKDSQALTGTTMPIKQKARAKEKAKASGITKDHLPRASETKAKASPKESTKERVHHLVRPI